MPDIRTTFILDSFDRADENPLSDGGHWANPFGYEAMLLTSNRITNQPSPIVIGFSSWTREKYEAVENPEVWGLTVGGGGGSGGEGWRLGMFQTASGDDGGLTGYQALTFSSTGHEVGIRRYNGGPTLNFTDLASTTFTPPLYFLLFRRNGDDLELWGSDDATATNWSLMVSATDTTYMGSYYLSLGSEDQGLGQICQWENFGGGTPFLDMPEFIRRPWEYQGRPLANV